MAVYEIVYFGEKKEFCAKTALNLLNYRDGNGISYASIPEGATWTLTDLEVYVGTLKEGEECSGCSQKKTTTKAKKGGV